MSLQYAGRYILPTWTQVYLEYGDASGMSDKDQGLCDEFLAILEERHPGMVFTLDWTGEQEECCMTCASPFSGFHGGAMHDAEAVKIWMAPAAQGGLF